MSEHGHKPEWIEKGKNPCQYCKGTGMRNRYEKCFDCHGKGYRSVGFMDSRDASGR